ncbi:toxin-antitoxin system YwqK family antitoxin [Candidatus Palauibacter sp.]|uniref:toxin-antitoxin system YwqK family antitoxin n=1 Tax=Candidatus Palauibacter sp. TaxID=3101350 RepID=UPI003B51747C
MVRLNRARITTVALFSLMAGPAHAQRLFEMEGIELRGSVRVLQYGAGTCNVLEHVETATEYERKKANHGQPVDVWQLDLSVYNGSGRPLDHLIARYGIAAEHPPCTNWTGPEAGQVPGHPEWGDWYGTIQRSGGGDLTAPGETLTRTVYLLVFREHQPRFDTWSVDYTFAGIPAPGTGGPPEGERGGRSNPGVPEAPGAAGPAPVGPAETCTGHPPGSTCWMEVANHPGCYLWNGSLAAGATVTWSGSCSRGYAQGSGTAAWRYNDGGLTSEGTLVDGKSSGNWSHRFSSGQVEQGPFVDGRKNGNWVIQEADGDVSEGPFVNGRRQGTWTWWFTSGSVNETPFVNGEQNGRAIECAGDPSDIIAWTLLYVGGEQIGRETVGPLDSDAPAARARWSALLSKPRPRP